MTLPVRTSAELAIPSNELAAFAADTIRGLDLQSPFAPVLLRALFGDVTEEEGFEAVLSARLTSGGKYLTEGLVREALARKADLLAPSFEEAFLAAFHRRRLDGDDEGDIDEYVHPAVWTFIETASAMYLPIVFATDHWHRQELRHMYEPIASAHNTSVLEPGGIASARREQARAQAEIAARLDRLTEQRGQAERDRQRQERERELDLDEDVIEYKELLAVARRAGFRPESS